MQHSMTRTRPVPMNGVFSDMEDEDNRHGPEWDETDSFTLRVVLPSPRRTSLPGVLSGLPAISGNGGLQCDQCGGWFGVTYWTCGACKALGVLVAPTAPLRSRLPLAPHSSWACPNCGCLNGDEHVSCGFC